ncbi:hypothetical protein ACPOL_2605 [Acidisarcina polymorpha]|uniref:Uncharacterized protein n=1 Tax=Acidisarcina polymorpha TaxID=2211140 RepID=A0A2Z5FYI3_9BACT|nr:hypothetical protein ACPOL_2605 [Acidisarcina polymorpha]
MMRLRGNYPSTEVISWRGGHRHCAARQTADLRTAPHAQLFAARELMATFALLANYDVIALSPNPERRR